MKLNKDRDFIGKIVIISVAVLAVAFIIYNFKFIAEKLGFALGVMTPFLIGIFIAYLFAKPLEFFEKKLLMKRPVALAVIYVLFIGLIVLAVAYVVPIVIDTGTRFANDLSKAAVNLPGLFQNYDLGPLEDVIRQNISKLTTLLSDFSNHLISGLSSTLLSVTSTFLNFLLGVIISFYMLLDKEKIVAMFKRVNDALFSDKRSDALEAFFQSANQVFSHFLRGLMLEGMIVAIISFIALNIIGLRYTVILAILIFILYLIPTLGLLISMIPVVVSTLTYNPGKALLALIVMLVIQQIDGNLIAPKIMGGVVGLDPFWILAAIMFFGALMGLPGIIFAIPFAAIVKTTAVKYIEKKELQEQLEKDNKK